MSTDQMTLTRRASLACGVLFLITFLTSIPALALFQPVLDDPAGFVAGDGGQNGVLLGVVLEFLLILANLGTAVVLFPLFRRGGEALSLGYVAARAVECIFIAAGIVFVLGAVSLRADDPGAASAAVLLAALKDWTFLLGPGMTVGIGNGLILGYMMLRSGLVPRRLAMLGMAAGPILLASGLAVLFGAAAPGGTVQALATVPEFVWELSLGVYLTVVGLRGATAAGAARRRIVPQPQAAG
jgi:hypothetical protein